VTYQVHLFVYKLLNVKLCALFTRRGGLYNVPWI